METVGVIVVIGLFIAGWWMYSSWLERGIAFRDFQSSLSPEELQAIFRSAVAHSSWKIIDDGNPMVAQSSLATGIRQQIALQLSKSERGTTVSVGPQRIVTKWGVPKKAHTIRMRLNNFTAKAQEKDPSIAVSMRGINS